MKIDCLMGTYGRYGLACEALACFLQQSRISQATLLIYNQHPVPLRFDHPKVRIVNETPPPGSLRYVRQRMHELADPAAELIHWWDDDDLYLPWHLDDCLAHIGDNFAWKPASSWTSLRNVEFSRHKNRFEGSWVLRADYVKTAPLDTHAASGDPTNRRCRFTRDNGVRWRDLLHLSMGQRSRSCKRRIRQRQRSDAREKILKPGANGAMTCA